MRNCLAFTLLLGACRMDWGESNSTPECDQAFRSSPAWATLAQMPQPAVSIVVIAFNMAREIPRTLLSLSSTMQREVQRQDYEIILVDNGSSDPIRPEDFPKIDASIRFHRMENASRSPVPAINLGLSLASADLIGVWIDGARLASPGIIANALRASKIHHRPVIATLGFHLGPEVQMSSIHNGYNQEVEDALLQRLGWMGDGYRLFDICAFAGSSSGGWFRPISEFKCPVSSASPMVRAWRLRCRVPVAGRRLGEFGYLCPRLRVRDLKPSCFWAKALFIKSMADIATNAPTSHFSTYHAEYVALRNDLLRPY